MRVFIALALASVAVAACSSHSETVERQTPAGRTVVSESVGVRPIGTVEIMMARMVYPLGDPDFTIRCSLTGGSLAPILYFSELC